jgi:hypothetical protein
LISLLKCPLLTQYSTKTSSLTISILAIIFLIIFCLRL